MYIPQLKKTLKSFALAHRDGQIKKRFSTLVTGGAGIGKTQIIKELATELDMGVIIVHAAQLEPGDLLGIPRSKPFFSQDFIENLFTKIESKRGFSKLTSLLRHGMEFFIESDRYTVYDLPNYLPHYQTGKDGEPVTWIDEEGITRYRYKVKLLGSKLKNKKELKAKHGADWDKKIKGFILFLDEINRVVGDDTKNAIFELPGDYALHEYEVPEHCVIFAAANPSTSDYQVNDMDQEKALMDRFVGIKAEGRAKDSIAHFKKLNFEPSIVSFIEADKDALMEKEKEFELTVTRTPRSYETLENMLKYVDLPSNKGVQQEVFKGILGEKYGLQFYNHLVKNLEITPSGEELVQDYDSFRERFIEAINGNEVSMVHKVIRTMYEFLIEEENIHKYLWEYESKEHYEEFRRGDIEDSEDVRRTLIQHHVQNIEHFLEDLLPDARMGLIKQVFSLEHVNDALCTSDIIFQTLKDDTIDNYDTNWLEPSKETD